MQDGEVAFVIVSWNARERIDQAVGSAARQAAGAACVLVVDNASEDGTADHLRTAFPAVRVIDAGANLGFPAGANLGIAAALADPACRYVALLNDDAWVGDDWLEVLLTFADAHPDGATFQGLTVDARDPEVVDSMGLYIGHAGRAIQLGYRCRGLHPRSGRVFGVNAAAALIRRAFLEAQPFGDEYLDSDLVMYLEDVDLAARAVVMGWHSYFVEGAVAYHLGSGEDREDRPLSLRLNARNDLLVLVKNLPWTVVARSLPGLAIAELARYRRYLREGEPGKVATILRGRVEGLLALPRFLRKRRMLAPHRRLGSAAVWEAMAGSGPEPG
jgi:N-acetylglucosaminyl-diphospho-decaprenol L-rhamnosyltransferase